MAASDGVASASEPLPNSTRSTAVKPCTATLACASLSGARSASLVQPQEARDLLAGKAARVGVEEEPVEALAFGDRAEADMLDAAPGEQGCARRIAGLGKRVGRRGAAQGCGLVGERLRRAVEARIAGKNVLLERALGDGRVIEGRRRRDACQQKQRLRRKDATAPIAWAGAHARAHSEFTKASSASRSAFDRAA